MKHTPILLLASLLLGTAGCQCHNGGEPQAELDLTVTATDIAWLRTDGNAWSPNDAIGVYALLEGKALSDDAIYDAKANVQYTTPGGNGTFSPADDTKVVIKGSDVIDVVAYYPYLSSVKEYMLPINTSDQSSTAAIDLLYAKATELSQTNHVAQLSFKHMLTKVIITVDAKNVVWTAAEVKLKEVRVDGTLSLSTGVVTTGSTIATPAVQLTKPAEASLWSGSMILPPQELKERLIALVVDGKEMVAKLPTFETLSGYRYTVKVVYTPGSASTSADLRVELSEITDWQEASSIPEVPITDAIEVTEVVVTPASATLTVGETLTLQHQLMPAEATQRTVTWTSSNDAIARVGDDAIVQALAAGSVVITATAHNGTKGSCVLTVKDKKSEGSIPDIPGENL